MSSYQLNSIYQLQTIMFLFTVDCSINSINKCVQTYSFVHAGSLINILFVLEVN